MDPGISSQSGFDDAASIAAAGLLLVGAVLSLNALALLGRVDTRSVGILNLLVGGLETVIALVLVTEATSSREVFVGAGIFFFGFTYLYVGLTVSLNAHRLVWAGTVAGLQFWRRTVRL